jgi:hypothetical protein
MIKSTNRSHAITSIVRKAVNEMRKFALRYARYALAVRATVGFKLTVN